MTKFLASCALVLVACGGDSVPDGCAKYAGQTCVSLELRADVGRPQIDQLQLSGATGFHLASDPELVPSTPLSKPVELPFVAPFLPGASFEGGAFAFTVRGLLAGNSVGAAQATGSVPAGSHLRIEVTLTSGGSDAGVQDAAVDLASDAATALPDMTDPGPPAPRQVAPLSTSRVTQTKPTFHWALPAGANGAHIEICSTRACATDDVVATIDQTGTSGVPTTALPKQVLFWRAFGTLDGGKPGLVPSPTWEFLPGSSSGTVDTSYGTIVDVNGDGRADIAIGATAVGTAYVYHGAASWHDTPPSVPDSTIAAPTGSGAGFGARAVSAGDVNGDGFGDLVVSSCASGAPTPTCAGHVYLFLGGPNGLGAQPTPAVELLVAGGAGFAVSPAGDVDGDGYADVIVGAPASTSAFVFRGGASLSKTVLPAWTLAPGQNFLDSNFGACVAGIGDIDGDGRGDVAVGASAIFPDGYGLVYRGSSFVANETPSGAAMITLRTTGGEANPEFTVGSFCTIAPGGDTNHDGFADFVTNSGYEQDETQGLGLGSDATVYLGGSGGASASSLATLSAYRMQPESTLPMTAAAGDFDGDGITDYAVGAPDVPFLGHGNTFSSGTLYLFSTKPGLVAGTMVSPALQVTLALGGTATYTYLGTTLSVGDYDGDGFDDVFAAAPLAANTFGAGYVSFGSASIGSMVSSPTVFVQGPSANSGFGY